MFCTYGSLIGQEDKNAVLVANEIDRPLFKISLHYSVMSLGKSFFGTYFVWLSLVYLRKLLLL